MLKAGYKGTNSAAARSWLKWGQTITEPTLGCVVIVERGNQAWQGHVGFYMGESKSTILVYGGNTSDSVGVASIPKNRVLGYRVPKLSDKI